MRLAHISDLHFGVVSLNPLQFFSKRCLGNLNFLFNRKKKFSYDRLIELIDLFKKEKISHVVVTGDLSVTSRKAEFKMGQRFAQLLKSEGITLLIVPGNHDHYTRASERSKRFYRYFESKFSHDCPINLKDDRVTYTKLQEGLWLVALDTARATSLISSQGHFSEELEANLEKALAAIPQEDKVIVINHFPFFQNEPLKKQLVRGDALKALLLKHPNVLLYLHGHTHRQIIADLRESELPIISDCGSTPLINEGCCHLINLKTDSLNFDVYHYDTEWKSKESFTFNV